MGWAVLSDRPGALEKSVDLPARRAVCGMFPPWRGQSAERGRPEEVPDGFASATAGKPATAVLCPEA
jgi:hypothetical protein